MHAFGASNFRSIHSSVHVSIVKELNCISALFKSKIRDAFNADLDVEKEFSERQKRSIDRLQQLIE
jgi:hypothetical protein